MKILFASDIHVSEDMSKRLPDLKDVFKQIILQLRIIQPAYFVILGDVFDKRRPTPREMQAFNQFIMDAREEVCEVILLEGNHDADNGVSALSYFKDLGIDGIRVVTPPYILFPNQDGKNGIYLGHEQIDGAKADNGLALRGGSSMQAIVSNHPECSVFAFGHLHSPQILKENPLCFYCGSINPVSFAEREDKKRLWLFDFKTDGTYEYTHIFLDTRPMYQFDVAVENDKEPEAVWALVDVNGALVKIVFSGTTEALKSVDETQLKKQIINELGAQSLFVSFKPEGKSKPRNEAVSETVSTDEALTEYFKDHPDKESILKEGKNIIKEVDNG